MKNPTPINQLPRFVETSEGTKKEASNEWLSIVIIGGFFAISWYVLKKLLNEPKLKKEEEPDNFNDKSYNCESYE